MNLTGELHSLYCEKNPFFKDIKKKVRQWKSRDFSPDRRFPNTTFWNKIKQKPSEI